MVSLFQIPESLFQCSTCISLKALKTYELGFSLDASNSSISTASHLYQVSTWVCLSFSYSVPMVLSVQQSGQVVESQQQAQKFLLFGTHIGQTLAVYVQGWSFSVPLGPPNYKEIFPNLKNQDQFRSRVCAHTHPGPLGLWSVCCSKGIHTCLVAEHSPEPQHPGLSTRLFTPCILAPTQCKAEHRPPQDQHSKIPGQPVFSITPSRYCQLTY